MSKVYKITQYDGEHPGMYMHIAPFAMNPKILREFEGYPIVTSKDYFWFIVFDNGEAIAFASLKVFKNKVKFINTYVTEPYRRKGIHTTLINERLKWCKENEVKYIEVDCLDSSLQQYLKLGFKEVKTFVKWHKLEKHL
jgi:GNAT superfamily N-acetyltransferase